MRVPFWQPTIAILLLLAASAGKTPAAQSDRVKNYNTAAKLLDEGRNNSVYSDLVANPEYGALTIELVDLLIEAAQRSCELDSALSTLESSPFAIGDQAGPRILFLRAFQLRSNRQFGEASEAFSQAGADFLAVADTLAATVCFRRSARSALSARDADQALPPLDTLVILLKDYRGPDRIREETVLMRGEALLHADRLTEADSLLVRSRASAREKGYRRLHSHALQALGKLAEKQQHFQNAAELYRGGLAETRQLGATERTAKLLNDLGQSEIRLGALDIARAHLDESEQLAQTCGADWVLGYVYYGRGALAEARGQSDTAKNFFEKSIDQHTRQGNTWSALGARLRLAFRLLNDAEYTRAIEQYNLCLEVYESTGSLYGMGWTLGGLGLANHRLGNFAEAETYYTRAADIRTRIGDRRGTAWCFNSLGMINDIQANYREAFEYQHRALEIYEELGDRHGIGLVHFGIGSVYFYLGNYSKSIEHYEFSRAIAEELSDGYLRPKVASGMASVYHEAGRLDLAEKFSLEYLESAQDTGEPAALLWALNNIAEFYIQTGDTTKAGIYIDEALSLLPENGMDHIRSRTLFLRGKTAHSYAESIKWTNQALALAKSNGLKELQWKYLSDLGEYHRLEGNTVEAKRLQEQAILEIEALRRGVGSDELRRHMLRPAMTPYDRMVSLIIDESLDENSVRAAYGFAERSKAQIFAALLHEALTRSEADTEKEQELRKDLVSQLSHYQSQLQDGTLDKEEKARLLNKTNRIERELLQREIRVAESGEDYAAVFTAQIDVTTLLENLAPSERLLSYFLGQNRSWLFTAVDGRLDVFELPDRKSIEEKAGYFIRLLRQQAAGLPGAVLPDEVIDSASSELFDILIGPVAAQLKRGESLVLVPDGLLNRLPFVLLKNSTGASLVENHALFYTPSLQSLHYLRKRETSPPETESEARLAIIAVGSSGIPEKDRDRQRVYPYTNIKIEPLPRAAAEARSIAGMFSRSVYLVSDDAGETAFSGSDLNRADILHIAAHSYVDNMDVRRSFIVLNPPPGRSENATGRIEDGLLQWHEITSLDLDASLVTLSACRAAGGVLAYGEGITGLTQAFLYAGAGCVLASFIDVPDRFAEQFMTVFYRHIKDGKTGAAALREAQREAMGWTDMAHGPALWGSFALIGDGNFVFEGQ